MPADTIVDLGEIGAVGGILRPIVFTLQKDGATWDLTGYGAAALRVWDLRTKTIVAVGGTTTITGAATGEVTYAPSVDDPIHAASGVYEGRVWATPSDGNDPEPSGLFRYRIGPGPGPA